MTAKRHALVTGASSGIGASIVERLLAEGWRVTGISRSVVDKTNPDYQHLSVDISDREQIERAIKGITADAFVHAAGFMRVARLGELSGDAHEDMWRVHVLAAEQIANLLLPQMPDGARMVLIGSRAAVGIAGRSQYGATKAALVSMARAWGAELAARQITVNVVAPAATATPMLNDPLRVNEKPKLPPMGRYIEPDEVAATVSFLLSNSARSITGQQILICAGSSL